MNSETIESGTYPVPAEGDTVTVAYESNRSGTIVEKAGVVTTAVNTPHITSWTVELTPQKALSIRWGEVKSSNDGQRDSFLGMVESVTIHEDGQ